MEIDEKARQIVHRVNRLTRLEAFVDHRLHQAMAKHQTDAAAFYGRMEGLVLQQWAEIWLMTGEIQH